MEEDHIEIGDTGWIYISEGVMYNTLTGQYRYLDDEENDDEESD